MEAPQRPHVHVLTLGGTIAMHDDGAGATPTLDADALLGGVPLRDVAVTGEAFRQVPSGALTLTDLIALAGRVHEVLDEGVDGVVVSQGTDTLAEAAFALDLLLDVEAPVVFTGAMRHPSLLSPDGPGNLAAAIRAAAAPACRGLGVLAALNDELHAARHVRKTSTVSTAAFTSPATGPLGWVVEGAVHLHTRPTAATPTYRPGPTPPPVALLPVALGDDLRLVEAVADAGYHAVVVEAFGAGHTPPGVVARLAAVHRRTPVVFASQVGAGPTLTRTYGYPGSERDLRAHGLIGAGWLDGPKARVLATLVLGDTSLSADAAALADAFTGFGGG